MSAAVPTCSRFSLKAKAQETAREELPRRKRREEISLQQMCQTQVNHS